jgi:hypothetical protein
MKRLLFLTLIIISNLALAQAPVLNNVVRNNTLSPAKVASALDALKVFTATGTNTYAINPGLNIYDAAYVSGWTYASGDIFKVTFSNTNSSGTITLNVNGEGAIAVKDSEGNDLEVGAIKVGAAYMFYYNGTQFRMMGGSGGGGGSGTVEGVTGDGVDNTDPANPVLTFPIASEVDNTPAGSIAATNVQTALNELDTEKQSIITFGTGVQAAIGVNIGSDGAPILFNGAGGTPSSVTLTNGTGLPGTSVINTPAGNIAATTAQAAINELDTEKLNATSTTIGAQDLFVSSVAMWPRVTGGCSSLTQTEIATSLFNVQTLDFDQTTQEFAQMQFVMPRNWNNGTITATVYWTAASGTGDVVWGISAGAYSDDDPLSTALGTAQTVTDTFITANDLHKTSTSSAINVAGTPADGDYLAIQISRNPADGSDTLTADAKLLGVRIVFTTDAGTSE